MEYSAISIDPIETLIITKNFYFAFPYLRLTCQNKYSFIKNIPMSLEQQIMVELKTAMLAKDEKAVRSLRAIKAAIITAKTAEGARGEISATDESKLLQKMVKQRRDSLEIFVQQNRDDLAQKEREELDIIERFLPKQLEGEQLKEVIKKIIEETGAKSQSDFGKVMGAASKVLAGQADGKMISAVVKELLAG